MRLDPRLTPARGDLAADHLRDLVHVARYAKGAARRVVAPSAPLKRRPDPAAPLDTEALRGEAVTLYDEADGWAWVQLSADGYVGYVPADALGPPGRAPTHRVSAVRTFVYPAPDMKRPPTCFLSLGAEVAASGKEGEYVAVGEGHFVFARHLVPCDRWDEDFVGVAERFLETPYLWGGKTSLGLDCSGLVQVALRAAGVQAPRDTDLQRAALGSDVAVESDLSGLRRGDLVFWEGHVGIMRGPKTLLHANAHHMAVASEPLAVAEARIRKGRNGSIACVKRL